MSGPIRRAGRFVGADGVETTWTVAEGRRGRRWRWVTAGGADGDVSHTLEAGPDGRFERLESARPGELLTLHREPDGSLHGNRVSDAGVDHVALGPSSPIHVLVGAGPIGGAAYLAGLGALAEAVTLDSLVVGDDLTFTPGPVRVGPIGRQTVRLEIGDRVRILELDADGLPVGDGPVGAGPVGSSWPLEVD